MKRLRTRRGFTLVEMMVAVSIFSIVMLISVSSTLAVIDANRKAQSLKSVVNNLNFTLEAMSRNIRVGTHFHCRSTRTYLGTGRQGINATIEDARDCEAGDTLLALEGQYGRRGFSGDQIIYMFDEENQLNPDYKGIYRQIGVSGSPVPMTAPGVDIDYLRFFVFGTPQFWQPTVYIYMRGSATVGSESTEFFLQTAATQRILDI